MLVEPAVVLLSPTKCDFFVSAGEAAVDPGDRCTHSQDEK